MPRDSYDLVKFTFDSLRSAIEALLVVVEDAASTKRDYTIHNITPSTILKKGLILEGDVADISEKVSRVRGSRKR